ncbi:non-hydrolyzing UDP-N-acetylglucosamine 2-epimerase [Pseudoalteromonas sp. meg-B1]|uniref:non-hydrolyzing UDP-N-acetylglucosamine 2-epimerase n=1 Tax=Pseudoalteromonas sp. meg-B1 TaxID=2203192 RepID=UPI000D6F5D9E|nr:UDP-N-acetylglucosamine 2-epimerase (non-hydrolyzing) [Pseudoalteromonas sp. meg-B1]PWS54341.1 UDP-N-acetylglucosamine 2-epimerase (non-hydrolyzing) [Pseudoalteromonas sp. meg-B1]
MKIVTILGARPQFIKAGSVSREFTKFDKFKEVIVHTGQHYDTNMSDVFFDEMKIPKPDYFLGIGGKSHGAMTGQMIEKIEEVLLSEKPDWVLVYGDTNSTLAGAIAASKLHIKVAHIEAGLRSFNMRMPEEVNRILTDRISSILFCPTQTAVDNLQSEGVDKWNTQIELSGDVMQDGAIFYRGLAKKPSGIVAGNEFILSTIHRAENTDSEERLTGIVESLNEIAEQVEVILPLHPRTKIKLESLPVKLSSKVKLIDPVGYLNMVWLIDNCKLVMTDSGGLQKEAFFFEKPCITLRDETEWVELVEHNFNTLVGANKAAIISTFKGHVFSNNFSIDLYGKGLASNNIANALLNYEK